MAAGGRAVLGLTRPARRAQEEPPADDVPPTDDYGDYVPPYDDSGDDVLGAADDGGGPPTRTSTRTRTGTRTSTSSYTVSPVLFLYSCPCSHALLSQPRDSVTPHCTPAHPQPPPTAVDQDIDFKLHVYPFVHCEWPAGGGGVVVARKGASAACDVTPPLAGQ
jgi:hypothetical protein